MTHFKMTGNLSSYEIKKQIRKILKELHGSHMGIKKLTDSMAQRIMETIRNNVKFIEDGREYSISITELVPQEEIKTTSISEIKFTVNFTKSSENKISGSFKSNSTLLKDDNTYQVLIELNMQIKDVNDNFHKQLTSVLSHEFNHALVYIKNLKGKRKSDSWNMANRFTQRYFHDLLVEYQVLKEFFTMIYLSNPYEVQARVQEADKQLEYIDEETPEQTLQALMQYNPLIDARKMINYSLSEVNKINEEIIQQFVKEFNNNIKSFSQEDNPKTIYNVQSFFKYWLSNIHSQGNKLAQKIYKLVADKHQIHEDFLYESTDMNIYKYIFGERYGHDCHK